MNFSKLGLFSIMVAMAFFVMSCGAEATTTEDASGEETEQHEEHREEDAHDSHDHSEEGESSEVDMDSPEYASAYVCPMHCEGSGSDTKGKCPVCKMSYVSNDSHSEEGHEH